MKKLIALMALASMFAVGCAHNKENQGGTSDSNYSTSDTSTGKMQNDAQGSTTTTNSSSSTQQP
jgi:hypothetical protein